MRAREKRKEREKEKNKSLVRRRKSIKMYWLAILVQCTYLSTLVDGIIADLLFEYFNKSIDHRFVKIDAGQYGNRSHHTILQALEVQRIDANEELIDTGSCGFHTNVHKLYGIR